jgi:hypothetical protein
MGESIRATYGAARLIPFRRVGKALAAAPGATVQAIAGTVHVATPIITALAEAAGYTAIGCVDGVKAFAVGNRKRGGLITP